MFVKDSEVVAKTVIANEDYDVLENLWVIHDEDLAVLDDVGQILTVVVEVGYLSSSTNRRKNSLKSKDALVSKYGRCKARSIIFLFAKPGI